MQSQSSGCGLRAAAGSAAAGCGGPYFSKDKNRVDRKARRAVPSVPGRPASEDGFYVIYTHSSLVTPDGCVDYLLSKLQR